MPSFSADDFTKIKERLDQIRKDEPIQSEELIIGNTINTPSPVPQQPTDQGDYYGCDVYNQTTTFAPLDTDNSTYTQEQATQDILDNYKRQAEKHLSEKSVGLISDVFKEFRMRGIHPDYSPHNLNVND